MIEVLKKIFGDSNDRELKRLDGIVDKIEKLEPSMKAMTDTQLRDKTEEFKKGLKMGKRWTIFFPKPLL